MADSLLKVGMNVDIQRSDGRIHSACVSGINADTDVVTVEWFEKGDTKGKEVDIVQIYELNPNVDPSIQKEPKAPSPQPVKSAPKSRLSSARIPLASVQHAPSPKELKEPRRVTSAKTRPSTTRSENVEISSGGPANNVQKQPKPRQSIIKSENVEVSLAGSVSNIPKQAGGNAAARRRSNVVKEVDRIKKNREERRANQAKQIQERIQEADGINHPQWEFLKMIRESITDLEYNPLNVSDTVYDHQITVCIRKRPLNKKELGKQEIDVITVPNKDTVLVHEPKLKVDLTKYLENQQFRFDYTLDENSTNEMVYRFTAKPLVDSIFQGGMATCFAYGQTGSGKTHTMGGNFNGKNQDVTRGIYAMAAADVFKNIQKPVYKKKDVIVSCSFFEIYSGKVFDLLNKKVKLRVLEDGKQQVQVVGLQEKEVHSRDDVLKLIAHGNSVRTSGTTSANQHSSRSHAVFQIILRKRGSGKLFGKFSLIDLAGNERGKDTASSNRQTRMEGAEINKSLLALKECIRSLGHKGAHVPFRASKLTQVLRDSFINDRARTCMIAMISPGNNSCEHTLNTLRYADRVKELRADGQTENGLVPLPRAPSTPEPSLSPSTSDIQMLCTVNEEECSMEMMTFHEVMNQLQEMEEQIVDFHRNSLEESKKLMHEEELLLQMTDEVDYDVEEYCSGLESILSRKIEIMTNLKERVTNFRQQITEEEEASKNIKRP